MDDTVLNANRTATRSSCGEGGRNVEAERPLAMLFNRIARVTNQLDEQLSMLADAKMNTLNRMIGDEPRAVNATDQEMKGPGRMLHFGGDFAELEETVMRLEAVVGMVVDRERYVTNRLTNIG